MREGAAAKRLAATEAQRRAAEDAAAAKCLSEAQRCAAEGAAAKRQAATEAEATHALIAWAAAEAAARGAEAGAAKTGAGEPLWAQLTDCLVTLRSGLGRQRSPEGRRERL